MIALLILFSFMANGLFNIFYKPGLRLPDCPEWIETMAKTVPSIWALFCYITAYYRFKESEIINRY